MMRFKTAGFLLFVVGIVISIPTVINDIVTMRIYGTIEGTALEFCYKTAVNLGLKSPRANAIFLWLMPAIMVFLGFIVMIIPNRNR